MANNIREEVGRLLPILDGIPKLHELFALLNYDYADEPIPKRNWPEKAAEEAKDINLVGRHGDFHIIHCQIERLNLTPERQIINQILKNRPYCLVIFSEPSQRNWHFVNIKYDEKETKRRLYRRIVIGPDERLRTAAERIAMLDTEGIQRELFGLSALAIQNAHDRAFDVEAVTKDFFNEYQRVFGILQKRLRDNAKDPAWAHDYALQFLNRLMFLYFIQRKKWLGNNPEFIKTFWETYRKSGQSRPSSGDTFFEQWLSVLFFEAFNEKFQAGRSDRKHLPADIRDALAMAPYLNGGLFTENQLDEEFKKHRVAIPDDLFETIFSFYERYNFTIREDTPFDQEVAVDPEMIGKVYESLVNITSERVEEEDKRGTAGIFYTPRIEIDLMCRLSLVDWLANHLGENRKPLLYEAVFAYEPEEKERANDGLARENLWPQLNDLLKRVTVLDPACGSGSFLVGMLMVLDDLQERANYQLGIQETPYERRKRVIGHSLYGVDVMGWAVPVAELRLWLQLVAETEIHPAELKFRPLLPNLSFKVRPGDSLVQEVAGINLGRHRTRLDIPAALKGRLTQLKGEKVKFYNNNPNDPPARFKSEEMLKQEERNLFREILEAKQHELERKLKAKVQAGRQAQTGMLGRGVEEQNQEDDIESLAGEVKRIEAARNALRLDQPVPFVWDIAFVEVFEGEDKGFDIVIANPPYVRQERLSPPDKREKDFKAEEWRRLKAEYKSKLQRSVALAYQKFFQYREGSDTFRKPDGKSDLYIYFYFHGLSLLNPKGSFCFITSNSWLDVGYGKDLQEFLLKHSQVKMLIDNQAKRSFSQSDINTIIALLGPPDDRRAWGLDKTARFVMFKVPFESILSPVVFEELEEANDRKMTPEYRVYPIPQRILYEEGLEAPEEEADKPKLSKARYGGNKWGGKYLRAPEVLYHLLSHTGRALLPLSLKLWNIEYGLKTGLTEFFYLTRETIQRWNIEPEFYTPILTSTHDAPRLLLEPKNISTELFLCRLTKEELRRQRKEGALNYILWGESQRTKKGARHTVSGISFPQVPSVQGNSPWYAIAYHEPGDFALPALVRERYQVLVNENRVLVSNMFYQGRFGRGLNREVAWAALNCSIVYFFLEIFGRLNIGGRLNFYGPELRQVLVPDPLILVRSKNVTTMLEAFETIKERETLPIRKEIRMEDRKALDLAILKSLALEKSLITNIYEFLDQSCSARLSKEENLSTWR